jgi:hypothetical protein
MPRLRQMAEQVHTYCKHLGVVPEDSEPGLQEGSKLYGRAFRLYMVLGDHSGHHTHPCAGCLGFLGMTKKEAFLSLCAMREVLSLWKNQPSPFKTENQHNI